MRLTYIFYLALKEYLEEMPDGQRLVAAWGLFQHPELLFEYLHQRDSGALFSYL